MGIDYTTYVGPFVVCRNTKENVDDKMRTCTTRSCQNYHRHIQVPLTKFCPLCGCKIEHVPTKTSRDKVDVYPLAYSMHEKLMPTSDVFGDEIDIWVGNSRDGVGRSFDSRGDIVYESVTAERLEREKTVFLNDHTESLAELLKAYGPGNVEIRWGVLCWAH